MEVAIAETCTHREPEPFIDLRHGSGFDVGIVVIVPLQDSVVINIQKAGCPMGGKRVIAGHRDSKIRLPMVPVFL